MIDKNGKLFGKINIIDLLIILIVIAALILVATKMFTPAEKGEEADTAKVVITYSATDAPTGTGESVSVGDPVYEDTTNVRLGTVTSVDVEEAYEYAAGPDGEPVKLPLVGMEFVTITTEVEASVTDDGVFVGGRLYPVGATRTIHFGKSIIYIRITDISPAA